MIMNAIELTADTEELKYVVGAAMRAVSTSSTQMEALKRLKFDVVDNGLSVTGTNLSLTIKTAPINVLCEEKFTFTVEGKLFSDMVRVLDATNTKITIQEKKIQIKSGKAKYNMPSLNNEDYPMMEVYEGKESYILPTQAFKRMAKQVLYAIGDISDKPFTKGTLIEIEADEISMVAVDGFRISHARCTFDQDIFGTYSVIVPGKSIQELVRIIPDDETIEFGYTETHAQFKTESFTVLTRLINAQFINYRPLYEFEENTSLEIKKSDFVQALEKVAVISGSLRTPVTLSMKKNQVELSVEQGGFAATDTIECQNEGKENEIALNHSMLLEAAKYINDDVLVMKLTTELAPLILTGKTNVESRHLVLPSRKK